MQTIHQVPVIAGYPTGQQPISPTVPQPPATPIRDWIEDRWLLIGTVALASPAVLLTVLPILF